MQELPRAVVGRRHVAARAGGTAARIWLRFLHIVRLLSIRTHFHIEMAEPASKKRKLEKNVRSRENDNDSFASFGDSQDGREEENGAESDGDQDRSEDGSGMDEDGDDGRSDRPVVKSSGNKQHSTNTPQHRKVIGRKDEHGSPYVAGNHKSTMFKLQTDELLEQIGPKHGKREIQAEEALHKAKNVIEKIPDNGPFQLREAMGHVALSDNILIPFPDPGPPMDAKYKFQYVRPTNINVIGSHALKTASRSRKSVEIDMVVTMPSSLFQEKDYLDFRYVYKRAYYIASIAAGLKAAAGQEFDLKFHCFHDNPLKPILVLAPAVEVEANPEQTAPPKWKINIIPCAAEDVFPSDKLSLDRCCIRNHSQATTSGAITSHSQVATPFYNSSLRSDIVNTSYLKLLHGAAKNCESFRDACLLGSTWLRQRGFGSAIHAGGFGNFEWSTLIAVLLQGGGPAGRPILNEAYSSYQLFKATVQLLAMREFCKQPLVISADGVAPEFSSSTQPIVWDATRQHNILYKMAPWSYRVLRQEARSTLSTLNDQQFDAFDATFILRSDGSLYRYDYVVELDAETATTTTPATSNNTIDSYRNLFEVILRGLGDRAKCINILPDPLRSWELESARPSGYEGRKVLISIMLDAHNAGRTIDHGPAAEEKTKAAAYRKFWGDKAELRRFKDGSISETIVWSGKENGPSVVEQILRHIIRRHVSDEAEQTMSIFGDGFRNLLPERSGSSIFQPFMDAFKQLETDIRSLDGLPLVVRQIVPADAQLRYASARVPSAGQCVIPANIVIQFEGSTRWPDDLIAIQRTKIAFLLKLREQLLESIHSISAQLGLENGENDILNQGFLDVVYDSGAAFRLRIHHDREQTLLERDLKDKTLDTSAKEVAALGLAAYKRDYIKSLAHTQAIARLCNRYPALSGTMRLLKNWFASHLLTNHIADEVIELMAARSFVQPWPWDVPASVQTGFLRTLFWLSRWDWKVEPLIVDMSGSGDLKSLDVQSIKTKFEAWRKLDPALNRVVLFTASNVDPDGTTWTDGRPAKVVAGRMTALARAASAEVTEKQLRLEPSSLFESPLSDFDFFIRIDPLSIGKKSHRKHSGPNGAAFKNLELDLVNDTSRIGLDELGSFLMDMEALHGSAILFFSGGLERPIIAGLWHPQTVRRPWKLNLTYSTTPVKDAASVEVEANVNKEAILAEIARLGGGMIQSIEINR